MEKSKCLQRIKDTGIVAVVRAENTEQALKIAEAVRRGGIDIIEITMTVPGALGVINELTAAFSDEQLIIGAGTVLDSETARAALLAGAEFIVSPYLNPGVVRLCNRYQKVCMPGAQTVTEIVTAMEAGADVIKIFPGEVLGAGFIKAVLGPLPYAQMIPTGGVSLENVAEWIRSGCIAVGVGGKLTAGAKSGDFDLVTATARQFVEKIAEARKK
ncbi:MAG TPA: bifunctional 2-keto-4-hydroxyglutarate aldolase/2-keto-3-deoxy-6-phosphogluconate aldolase [Bacillota bacterium]|jgi:2-dehydro-3-deoxyphosphogluconate aldolase/(4S)-4-hydroxy-2-oxoglutarate aldolase|nr:bifunctional 2-keto-4-hydroxyglutarate aldolase/2-keto-3-deoxy-6-phosphogluconate aldolase [Bacillota bacterium]HOA36414.1 bifunctional 2-keto-4-hydroxyglutarate aldolase/2-keto-3-deoxy-6-phosphogluconate aldolase [Bacillota bacterium]HOJ85170.1 bifunctional 2-keto-4-hydroxyglutarate aldolase/2-keto-3-deoxy-6-phosphogluconate aldolase [Bacillota bacterium]HOL15624.1 bifunctional 2-keto-4-hydroxyglutarate aldolase/2-keto-3-deoxy-6-phosphogluconate aldolase [Bacillota bacterium]HPZ11470.1 bifu